MNIAPLIFALAAPAAAAIPTPADDAVNPAVQINSVLDFVMKGGPVMIPIGLCSLIAFGVLVERLISLRRGNVIPADFLPGLKAVLKDGGSERKAIEYCRKRPSAIAHIFIVGLKRLGEPVELLEKHIQEAGEREALRLRKYLRVLAVIAAVSPLLGLLGTIFGMISAFQTVAVSGEALGKTELLAEGIYEAMITTAAGLIVAIPSLIAFHWLSAKIDGLVMLMDRMTVEFVEDFAHPRAGVAAATARATEHASSALPPPESLTGVAPAAA